MELGEFAAQMRQYGQRVVDNGNLIKRKVALAVDSTVVLATPVDTGRARSNWQASLDSPASGTLEAYMPGKSGSSGAQNAEAAMSQAKEVLGQSSPGQTVCITNNLPYIGRLNDGWSAQAPANFVQQAVAKGIEAVQASAPSIFSVEITK